MDKQQIDKLHLDIAEAVRSMCEERGFTIRRAGGSIGEAKTTLKYEIGYDAKQNPEVAQDAERKQFEMNCICRVTGYGKVMPNDYGKILVWKGEEYRLIGVNRDADKYPLQTRKVSTGELSYRFPLSLFVEQHGKQKAA